MTTNLSTPAAASAAMAAEPVPAGGSTCTSASGSPAADVRLCSSAVRLRMNGSVAELTGTSSVSPSKLRFSMTSAITGTDRSISCGLTAASQASRGTNLGQAGASGRSAGHADEPRMRRDCSAGGFGLPAPWSRPALCASAPSSAAASAGAAGPPRAHAFRTSAIQAASMSCVPVTVTGPSGDTRACSHTGATHENFEPKRLATAYPWLFQGVTKAKASPPKWRSSTS
mmetsp:Transcript_24036/g.90756  ORF Transcript_24036/g.90756 Transcript_24036/m.90756 type:complete len:228 (-) Transcript_24036:197-880(-)